MQTGKTRFPEKGLLYLFIYLFKVKHFPHKVYVRGSFDIYMLSKQLVKIIQITQKEKKSMFGNWLDMTRYFDNSLFPCLGLAPQFNDCCCKQAIRPLSTHVRLAWTFLFLKAARSCFVAWM